MTESNVKKRARSAVAEFFVIVLGVLVALGVDELRADRADAALEVEYGRRLIDDLEADSANFAGFRDVLGIKADILMTLLTDPAGLLQVDDPVEKMRGVVYSTFVGLPRVSLATFDELGSTGRLGLIESRDVRSALGAHYSEYRRMTEILDQRFGGGYREKVFAALPGVLQFEVRLDEERVDPDELRAGLERLVRMEDLEGSANAELAYTAALLFYLDQADQRTSDLLVRLRAAYGDQPPG